MQLHFARWRVPVAAFVVACALAGAAIAQARKPAPIPLPPREKGPTTIDADKVEGVGGQEVTARGNVELRQDDTVIFGDYLRFNQEFGRVEADGGVRMRQGNDRFSGSRLRFDTRNHTGVLEEPAFSMRGDQPARGKAEQMEFLGPGKFRMKNGSYTTCEPGRDDWHFDLSQLDLDYDEQTGTMRNATLNFFGTTVGPLPWMSFALENRRKSGFLSPSYAQTSRGGLELSAPFYWNIAPEQDATLTPRFISRRGLMLLGGYRYIDRRYTGEMQYELLPNDSAAGRTRSGFALAHKQTFSPALTGYLDLNKVSDNRYFIDLSSRVSKTSQVNLPREGFLQYSGNLLGFSYYLQSRIQRFQTLQDPLAPVVSPYERLPQLTLGTGKNDIAGIGDFSMPVEYTRFTHSTLVEGQRVVMNPTFVAPIAAPGYFITPKIGLHYAGYNLVNTPLGTPDKVSVTIPWFSLDGGLVYERNVRLFGQGYSQTLEPRLFYVHIPYRGDQSRVPLFDTGLADFNYTQIFTENRFAGGDRFGDANQLTAAVTTRLLSDSGQELLRATIAQRYYFENESLGLTPTSDLRTYKNSDVLASVGGKISKEWSFDAGYQYNGRLSRTERFNAAMRYSPELAKVINLGYRFTRDTLEQFDISGQWPVRPGWYGVGRYNFSLKDGVLLEGIAGLEYNAGCWIFRVVGQRLQTATQLSSTSVFVQLELGELAKLGSDPSEVLRRSVAGYTSTRLRPDQAVPSSMQPKLPFDLVY